MAQYLKKFIKHPDEVKRYTIDYSEWLDTDEEVTAVTFEVTPTTDEPLQVDSSEIDDAGQEASFFLSGGHAGETYDVLVTANTNLGQVKVACLLFAVRDC